MRRINILQILDAFAELGPCSRVDLTRYTGLSAPTVSKLMEDLLRRKWVETLPMQKPSATGRPSVIYRLATEQIQFLGVVIDIENCRVVSSGLDGVIPEGRSVLFKTPKTYARLISTLAHHVKDIAARHPAVVMGVGLSVPGLLDKRDGRQVLSPNLHFMDKRFPARDVQQATGFTTVAMQEEHCLCLSEQMFGQAREVDDFAMIDISAGMGMGVVSAGRFISGAQGFAGELGHVTVDPGGILCGCGNRGCLETVATDMAFLRAVNARTGHDREMAEVLHLVQTGGLRVERELRRVLGFLSIGVGMVVNFFNPTHVYLYGRLFDAGPDVFDKLVQQVKEHAIPPSMSGVSIVRARGSKRLGALAAIIQYHRDMLAPRLR